jgi:hypothetical protein
MNQIPLGEALLKVTRATVGMKQQVGFDGGVGAISMLAGSNAAADHQMSRVVCLMNMVTNDELLNDDEYDGKFFLFLPTCILLILACRDQGRHRRRVWKVRTYRRMQNSPSRWSPQQRRCRQDLHQVRRRGISAKGHQGTRWSPVLQEDSRRY